MTENVAAIHGRSYAMIKHARAGDLDLLGIMAREALTDPTTAAAQMTSLAITGALLVADCDDNEIARRLELAAVSLARGEPDGI